MAGQFVQIESCWDGVRFHCPACGAEVFDDQGVTHKACSHLLFTWFSETGDMDHVSSELAEPLRRDEAYHQRREELEAQDENYEEPPRPDDPQYAQALEDNDVVFCLSYGGMACGPCGGYAVIAIRFPDAE